MRSVQFIFLTFSLSSIFLSKTGFCCSPKVNELHSKLHEIAKGKFKSLWAQSRKNGTLQKYNMQKQEETCRGHLSIICLWKWEETVCRIQTRANLT